MLKRAYKSSLTYIMLAVAIGVVFQAQSYVLFYLT